jgi:hypothetical protein
MSGVYQIPPARDLSPVRLAQRREHLLAEIVRDREFDRAPAPARLPWFRRPKLVALVAVTFLLLATACAFGVRALVLDKGFIGLPPEGATPSTPASGELVLAYFGPDRSPGQTGEAATSHIFVYADGRLISYRNGDFPQGANRFSSGFLEQRLTAEGVELLRSEVVSTLVRPEQASPPDSRRIPLPWFYIEVRDGDRLFKQESTELLHVHFPITRAEFERFVARLTHPESWLPASAWVERKIRAYVPARYAVCGAPSRILSSIPPKAEELLAKAKLLNPNPWPGETCHELTTEEARAVAEALHDGGFEPDEATAAGVQRSRPITGDAVLQYSFGVQGQPGRGYVYFEPILPHGEPICSPCG